MKAAIVAAVIAAVLGGLGLGGITPPSNLVEGGAPGGMEPVAAMPEEIVTEQKSESEDVNSVEIAVESHEIDSEDPSWGYVEPDWETYEPEPYSVPEGVEWSGDVDLRIAGVVNDGGNTYTWYSENVLPGNGLDELNANGRTVDDRGFVVDGEGYIAIASPDESVPIGTEVDTPWGPGRVYDYNDGGSYDVYTSW